MAVSSLLVAQTVGKTVAQNIHRPIEASGRSDVLLKGLSVGLTFTGAHDSYLGWYTVATPALAYTFSPHYSADISASIYPFRLAPSQRLLPPANARLVSTTGNVGDTYLALHATFDRRPLQSTATLSVSVPTGNRPNGLGSGHVTFDFSDHLEHYVGRTGFIVDLGGGNASGLVNPLVTETYDSLGAVAHFQTGVVFWSPLGGYFQAVAYEQLPLGDQKTYTTIDRPRLPPQTVVTGRNISEDNGFTTSLGIPLSPSITLSASYNRSLRFGLDTVSTGITYVWRGSSIKRKMSIIDRAMREAEAGTRISKEP